MNALLPSADGLAAAGFVEEDCFGVLEPLAAGDVLPEELDLVFDWEAECITLNQAGNRQSSCLKLAHPFLAACLRRFLDYAYTLCGSAQSWDLSGILPVIQQEIRVPADGCQLFSV